MDKREKAYVLAQLTRTMGILLGDIQFELDIYSKCDDNVSQRVVDFLEAMLIDFEDHFYNDFFSQVREDLDLPFN